MKKKPIVIGGIHGVGKTTLCEKLSKELGIEHYTASDLIRKIKNSYISIKDKRAADINDNQNALVLAIENHINTNLPYFLDGHFCLLEKNYSISRIPKRTFQAINPVGVIIFYDDVLNIQKRLNARDNESYNLNLLSDFQEEEIDYSKEISEELKIPHLLFKTDNDTSVISQFVQEIIGIEE